MGRRSPLRRARPGTVLVHHVADQMGDLVDMDRVVGACPTRTDVVRF
ncbi:MAG: hypothetical protein JNL21_30185 [Myxococcales bacterium]|nr:hypothetical protein [Myxococcales bacterium]